MAKTQSLIERLNSRTLVVLDGAMGTQLQEHGFDTKLPLWSALAVDKAPELVAKIHRAYVDAGADIITTNTFRTNRRMLARAGASYCARELTLRACELARSALNGSRGTVCIAGSMGPVEDCYKPEDVPADSDLWEEHGELASHLAEGGVDLIIIETMNCVREAFAACAAASQTKLPFGVSFVCKEDGNLLSGESLEQALEKVGRFGPIFVGSNCASVQAIENSVAKLCSMAQFPVCVYPQGGGSPDSHAGWQFHSGTGAEIPDLKVFRRWMDMGVSVLGGCCGTSPEFITRLNGLRGQKGYA